MRYFRCDSAQTFRRIRSLCVVGIAFTVCHAMAQQDAVVQLKDDPYRRVALENTLVRVWDVRVPVGESTPFHEHKMDTVNVRINSTVVNNVPKGGLFNVPRDFQLEAGSIGFSEYSKDPYIHRITPKGPNPHHVIEVELLGPPADRVPQESERSGFTTVLDNSRIRASRFVLEGGRATNLIARRRNTLVVVVSGERVHEESAERGGRTRELRAGEVEWHSEPSSRSLRNDGASNVVLIELEVK